jgi:hypothetical protein
VIINRGDCDKAGKARAKTIWITPEHKTVWRNGNCFAIFRDQYLRETGYIIIGKVNAMCDEKQKPCKFHKSADGGNAYQETCGDCISGEQAQDQAQDMESQMENETVKEVISGTKKRRGF